MIIQDENTGVNDESGRNTLTFDSPEERREFWMAVVQEQVESGMSAYAFCKQQDLSPSSFHHWKQKLKKQSKADDEPETHGVSDEKIVPKNKTELAPYFAEVKITSSKPVPADNAIEISHGNFRFTLQPNCDRVLLKDLLCMLGEIPC